MKKFLTLFAALLLLGSMTVVQAVTYTPAGTPASVFTNEWTPNTPANDMVLSNGLYVFAKKSNFSQTAIQFKVCKDHAWTTAYPGSNYEFDIPAGSKYLIITYKDDNSHAVNAFAISSMTVAGEPDALFGSTWTPSATANDMTLQNDGTYKFEKSGVALTGGSKVKFKACANHGWDNAWPSSNYELSIPESGNYTITITFNPATLSVSASADLEEAVVVIPNIQLHSNIKNPSWETTANFDIAGNNETASLTLTGVTKGNYEFGVKIDGTWTSNGTAFTRANNSHAIAAGSGNCTFNADRNGDYTFTWTYATNTLEIGYPAEPDAFVAGSATAIFGAYWDGSAEANKMTWDGELGKFAKTYTVDKAYKSVSLKVVYDNQWYGVNGGEDNVKFSLSGAGTFTVLFDKTNHHVTLDGEIVGEEQFDFEYAAVAANGEGNWAHGEDWNAATTTNRMTEVSANVWEISFDNVPAKECQFKFCFDGTWDHEFGGIFTAFDTESPAVYGNTSSSINFTSIEGSEITIRLDLSAFNFATKEGATFTVSQVEPAPTFMTVRTELTEGRYYTMCLDKAVTAVQGASIWRVVSKAENGFDIILEEVEGTLDAGRPYIFYAAAENLEVVYNGAEVGAPVNDNDNHGLIGSFEKVQIEQSENNYIIYHNELYYVNSEAYVGAHRAYLDMTAVPAYSGAASAPGRRRVVMTVHREQTTTDIDALNASEAPVKMIIDGQLFIIRGEQMFNANGQLVK